MSSSLNIANNAAAKALRTMRRILDLNRAAVRHSLLSGGRGGGKTTTPAPVVAADSSALDALHEAEWMRCHLVDELRASPSSAAAAMALSAVPRTIDTTSAGARMAMAMSSSKKQWMMSSSFTFGGTDSSSLAQSPRRQKYTRRISGDEGDAGLFVDCHSSAASSSDDDDNKSDDNDVARRTSYIYQRMDFDEGMHSFAGLERIDPAAFWLSSRGGGGKTMIFEMSPAVESTLAFNLGQIHRRAGDLDSASKCYDRALEVLRRSGSGDNRRGFGLSGQEPTTTTTTTTEGGGEQCLFDHPIAIPVLHNIGQLQYCRGDFALAAGTYALALERARSTHGERHAHVASALNCLGVLHYHDANSAGGGGDKDCPDGPSPEDRDASNGSERRVASSSTEKAMDLFQRVLSIRMEALGPDHVDVATVLNNIGRIHVQLDEFDRALGYYEDALRIRRAVLGADSLDYAATAFNAGQSLHQRGDLDRAAELYREFLRVALARFGRSHRDVAVVLSGIAQIHQEKGEHDEALELYEASLCAGRAALGENHSEIAMLLNRMGNFHFERERLEDALRCYRRGLRIERAVLPPDHPNIVVTLSNLGEIHRQRSEWDEAARMYGDCLDILRTKHDGADHADVASTLSTVGLIHDQRGDMCLSLRYLQDALLMRRRLLGNDHLDVAATLVYIGTILYRKSVFSVAIELFAESLRIRRAALGRDHRDVAFVLYNIALVHQQRGCYEEAAEAYSETLRIEKLVLGEGHRDVSMTLFKLGEVNRAAGNLDEALGCFRESLLVEQNLAPPSDDANPASTADASSGRGRPRQQAGPDHGAMARALNEIGNIHLARGEVVPMMEAFNEASRLYRAAGLSPNNVVVSGHLYALEFSCPEAAPAA